MSSLQSCFCPLYRGWCQQEKLIAGEPVSRNCNSLLEMVQMSPGRKLTVSVCSRPCPCPSHISLARIMTHHLLNSDGFLL